MSAPANEEHEAAIGSVGHSPEVSEVEVALQTVVVVAEVAQRSA